MGGGVKRPSPGRPPLERGAAPRVFTVRVSKSLEARLDTMRGDKPWGAFLRRLLEEAARS